MTPAPKRRWRFGILIMALSIGAGAFIWVAPPQLLGEGEPWDTGGSFYVVYYLLGVGFVGGAIAPRWLWAIWAGVYVGQFAGIVFTLPKLGSTAPFGLLCFLPVLSLVSLAGGATAAVLRTTVEAISRSWRSSRPPHS